MAEKTRGEWEVVLPLPPAGCGGRCFPAPSPLCVFRDARAALVWGPSPSHPSQGCGSAPPCSASQGRPSQFWIRRLQQDPRGDASGGGGGRREQRERMQRETPDALASPSSPSLQLGARDPPGSPAPARPAGSRAEGRRVPPVCSAGTLGSQAPRPLSRTAAKSARKKWLNDRNS